ncbi:nitrogenase molybdenum-iron protein alpha chain [Treponema bryantii]|uniref:Nitrogenase molybdenum-iron protein alpha chain n=1 Tax=Treponema bryantii TaxID=163 RepID=A0A1H9ECP7_9SPIR|nr:nitrogenase component 1 [Treponema bryantii]SEQ23367.1 nitrogenase molybdenum-iron protein alpha chain [Treponema bryantii]
MGNINLNTTSVEVRDHRIGTIISYHGSASQLVEESRGKSVREPKRTFTQCSDCSQGCAETLTYMIRGAAVVIHSPLGCCNPAVQYVAGQAGTQVRNLPPQKVQAISTNISIKETVYGGVAKLRTAVLEAYKRFSPSAIFVQSSCAAGIIGDDIESVADELEPELNIPIIPIYCEGFKSKTWASGFDAVFHGVLRKIVKEPKTKDKDLVNVFNFQGCDAFTPFFEKLGLKPNLVVPLSTVEMLARMSEAVCSTHICETLGTYVSEALEKKYGVVQVKAPSPYGIDWTDQWVRALCEATGRKEAGEKLIAAEHERIKEPLKKLREKLSGKKAYIFAGHSYAHNLANIARDLGMEVIGVTTLHHDQITDSDSEELNTLDKLVKSGGDIKNFSVCNRQPYIMVKLLKKIKPDVLLTRHNNIAVVGTKVGIASIRATDANVIALYDGVINLGNRILEGLSSQKFYDNVAAHVKLPYTQWWLQNEDPFLFETR